MLLQSSRLTLLIFLSVLVITSCNNDSDPDPGPGLTGNSETYTLIVPGSPGGTSTIKFEERTDNSTVITIAMMGASGGHPVHIHANTASEGGGIVLDLAEVDAAGASVTEVTELNDATAITYTELVTFDGYVNVHNSASDLGTLIAQADIGQNALTGNAELYNLFEAKVAGISGEAIFFERINGETLVIVDLEGTTAGGDHPAHIHLNTAAEGGGIAINLSNVDGESGLSFTNISQKNDMSVITYSELTAYNGYINIHNSSSDLGTLIAQGDIGQNELTGTSVEYVLNEVNTQGVTGTITFAERESGFTLVTISISGTGLVGDHAAHIHENDVATTGGVLISLTNVDDTGSSLTSVSQMNDASPVTYTMMIGLNGYAQVHAAGGAPLTNGNIGSN